jgi:FkbH-like protein
MRTTVMGETGIRRIVTDGDNAWGPAFDTPSNVSESLLIWGEHCTDCANPHCYTTCALYTPRLDLKCRRFANGLEYIRPSREGVAGREVMETEFRAWGKLEAEGNPSPVHRATRRRLINIDEWLSRTLDHAPLPYAFRRNTIKAWNWFKRRVLLVVVPRSEPAAFLLDIDNIGARNVDLSLSIFDQTDHQRKFERVIQLPIGRSTHRIEAATITAMVPLGRHVRIALEPLGAPGTHLRVFTANFVGTANEGIKPVSAPYSASEPPTHQNVSAAKTSGRPAVKCVVWDLDNTLWRGVLVEDGPDGITLNPAAVAAIVDFDRRGILNSIASKNDIDLVEPVLRRFGLTEYFLHPQVHWQPKSASIATIAKSINIGVDTLVLVDDQPFERDEVQTTHRIETFDIADLEQLHRSPRLPTVITAESRNRRKMYQEEGRRTVLLENSFKDYRSFLTDCKISLHISSINEDNFARILELSERTNQLNYSGVRYSRLELQEVSNINSPMIGVVLSCTDRFGDYGIIGLAVVDAANWTLNAMFMSCRVQRKKVENAFFGWLADRAAAAGASTIKILFRPTGRNAASLEILEKELALPVVETSSTDAERTFLLHVNKPIVDRDIVNISGIVTLPSTSAQQLAWT